MRPLGNGGAGRRRWLEHDAAHAAARLVPTVSADGTWRTSNPFARRRIDSTAGTKLSSVLQDASHLEVDLALERLRKPASHQVTDSAAVNAAKQRSDPPRAPPRPTRRASHVEEPSPQPAVTRRRASRTAPSPRITDSYAAAAPRRRRASAIATRTAPPPRITDSYAATSHARDR